MISWLLASCVACAGSAPPSSLGAAASAPAGVEVLGAADDREQRTALERVEAALRKHGDLGVYGDLSVGLAELGRTNHVRITSRPDGYRVEIAPHSGQGHDFSFRIDPRTLALDDLAVGEIARPPR